ncbi:MAG: ATP-binding protein [Candidatus Phaeomarinobacter sp.]
MLSRKAKAASGRATSPQSASAQPTKTQEDSGDHDPVLAARAYNDLVDYLHEHSKSGRFTPPLVFLICFLVFQPHVPVWSLLFILFFQLGGTAFAEWLRSRHQYLSPDADRRPWAMGYMVVSGVCGLSWGLAGALWMLPDHPELQVVMVTVLVAGVTGSLVTRSAHLPSLAAFVLATGIPFVGTQLYIATASSFTLALLALVFASSIQGWAKNLNKMYMREAMARLRADGLIEELKEARDEAESRAAEAIEARHAAEAGARAKTEFLATISHEVRTPLNGIQGMAELMQATPLDAEQKDCVATIRESADSLSIILDDIIDLSLHESGAADYEQGHYHPMDVAAQIIKVVEADAQRKNLEVNLICLPGVPAAVMGDEKRCRQVLLNLMGNAVKFTDQGHITIKLSIEESTDSRELLRYAVRDTGIGIAPSDLERLFADFAQLDQSATRRHGGRGLGLALVQRIVKQMGGDVGVRSTLGEGSEFWFDIPLSADDAHHAQDTACPVAPSPRTSKIAELSAALGKAKAAEIVEGCLDAAWTLTETIEAARRRRDLPAIGRAAHDLRSTAGNIGMQLLESCAGAIDVAVRAGDGETAFELAARLPGEIAKAQAELIDAYPQFALVANRIGTPRPDNEAKAS